MPPKGKGAAHLAAKAAPKKKARGAPESTSEGESDDEGSEEEHARQKGSSASGAGSVRVYANSVSTSARAGVSATSREETRRHSVGSSSGSRASGPLTFSSDMREELNILSTRISRVTEPVGDIVPSMKWALFGASESLSMAGNLLGARSLAHKVVLAFPGLAEDLEDGGENFSVATYDFESKEEAIDEVLRQLGAVGAVQRVQSVISSHTHYN